jgi:exonuclease SbcD
VRLLHTSDWHLGHLLHDVPRDEEHDVFLRWLLDTIAAEDVDALVVAGDVFETANPGAQAQRTYYEFLARARRRFPDLTIIIIAGNHDSAARLDAVDPVLRPQNVRVVGALPRRQNGTLDPDRLLVPVRDRRGRVAAWVVAVPFLRDADLPPGGELAESVRRVYAEAIQAARARREPDQAIVATGHLYMTGGLTSDLSERKIQSGNQHAVPADVFPPDIAYAALGHLHLAQAVGGRNEVRYSGSPIPLSLAEARYQHQVVLVELEGERATAVRPIPVPRAVELLRVPAAGALAPDELVARLRALSPRDPALPDWRRPFLEVAVRLEKPEPGLRRRLDEALADRAPRLVKITTERAGGAQPLAEAVPGASLDDLTPEEVFRRRWLRDHEGQPPAPLLAAFHQLLDAVGQEDAS